MTSWPNWVGAVVATGSRSRVLVANRLVSPSSEHGLARWLETDFVCDQRGRRWTAAWRDDVERKASRSPRVRIAADQLQRWYRTLDQLLARKAEIEHALFLRLRDLFLVAGRHHCCPVKLAGLAE